MKRASLADSFSALEPDITWIIEDYDYFSPEVSYQVPIPRTVELRRLRREVSLA